MPFSPVQPLESPTYSAMLFNGTWEHAQELVAGINGVLNTPSATRRFVRGEAVCIVEGEGPPFWWIRLLRPNQEELWAYPDWWIVLWSNGNIEFYNDADYRAKFTLPEGMQ